MLALALERSHPGACIAELLESAASGDRGKVSGRDPAREVLDCRAQTAVRSAALDQRTAGQKNAPR